MYQYILSGELDYSLLICDDAGPGYARNMGWTPVYLNDFDTNGTGVVIIDPRILESELKAIEELVIKHTHIKFFFRIADPSREICSGHYYYKFLSSISNRENVFLLSQYQPREIVADIQALYLNRFIDLPYPYIKEFETETSSGKRRNRIIISGSINRNIYPYRTAIWEKVTRSFTRLLFFSILKHPGYLDMQAEKKHSHAHVGKDYIKHLSGFKYMLACPSKFGIELLKYSEMAYAGCIPVGQAPDSYPEHIKDLFLPLRPEHFKKDLFSIFFRKKRRDIVKSLRAFLHETRNPVTLNKTLEAFISKTAPTQPVNINE